MLPLTVFADAEKAVIDGLAPFLHELDPTVGINVRGSGARFVRVRRVGGVEESPGHDRPVIDVLIWHDSDKSRMALANQLWAWFRALNNDPAGAAVLLYVGTVLGPRQMPDPADDTKAVAMFTVELVARPA